MPLKMRNVLFVAFLIAFPEFVAGEEVRDNVNLWAPANTGAFFRVKLMLDPFFRDGFPPSTEIEHVAVKVFHQLNVTDERFKELFKGSTNDATEEEAARIVKRFQTAFRDAADETEIELQTEFDNSVYRKVLSAQLGLNGLYGLRDPVLREFLEIDTEHESKIKRLLEKRFQSIQIQNPTKSPVAATGQAGTNPSRAQILEFMRSGADADNVTSDGETGGPKEQEGPLPVGLSFDELQEREQCLKKDIWPLLNSNQKGRYSQAVAIAKKLIIDLEKRTSNSPLVREPPE